MKLFKMVCTLSAALALFGAATSASAADHLLQIKLDGPATQSILVIGRQVYSSNSDNGQCFRAPYYGFPRGWWSPNVRFWGGTPLQVIAFTSKDCSYGYRRDRKIIVPGADGLSNVYVPLF